MFIIHISVSCPKCVQSINSNPYFDVEIDEGFFNGKKVMCDKNHASTFISISPRYQYLIQRGIEAFSKGFFIESFHSLYSGYEAYKKEFLGAYLLKELGDIQEAEKILKQQYGRSERLDGAFISSYIYLSGGIPPILLHQNSVKLRNDIVHKGVIPSKENCMNIGNQIFEFISISNLMISDRCLVKELDFHSLLFTYVGERANNILNKKGINTTFETIEDFNNKSFIKHQFADNLLAPNIIIQAADINNTMFEEAVKQSISIKY